jgi:glycosyltransferase involved in cell wall biosynthesis
MTIKRLQYYSNKMRAKRNNAQHKSCRFFASIASTLKLNWAPMICAAVIPCLNEHTGIAELVSALRQQVSLVVVVDDGSTDYTASLAKDAGAVVVKHERNLGKGAALKTGLSHALKQGYEWAVTLDGDGQHAPEDLPALLRCAEQTGALLVIGNRMGNARTMPWLRRRVNLWMSRKLSQRAGRQLPDTQSGFRLIHLPAWAALSLITEHFEIESEMLMAFLAAEHPVAFAPIRVISRSRSSHIHPVTDSLRWWKWWRNFGRLPTSHRQLNSAAQAPLPVVAQTEL